MLIVKLRIQKRHTNEYISVIYCSSGHISISWPILLLSKFSGSRIRHHGGFVVPVVRRLHYSLPCEITHKGQWYATNMVSEFVKGLNGARSGRSGSNCFWGL